MSQTRFVIGALEDFTQQQIIRLAFSIHAELVEITPVDTGWARANWFFSVGTPGLTVPGPAPRRNAQGVFDTARVAAAEASNSATQASVLGYSIQAGAIFVQNNVPYIVALNAGGARREPAGFIQRGITRGVRRVNRVI